MASHRSGFEKRERERAKRAKQAAKREKRAEKPEDGVEGEGGEGEDGVVAEVAGPPDQASVLEQLAKLHQKFDDGDITFEDFEEQRTELTEQLDI